MAIHHNIRRMTMLNPGYPQLVESVGLGAFMERFEQSPTYSNSFSYQALKALHNWYEELADDMGEDVEFDYIGICCTWSEYEASELDEVYSESIEELDEETYIIKLENGNVLVHEF
jgi:hypothetical protein